ncbi:DNA-binding GntR family transcriptional regulator [Pullulanibacillus pueri]|uniref:GntR family transcriptional regulator n=1 Tax=Pullulanibacillus pueri TaxID=1437324 RepID=A0A8J2ZY53_9BACL|nr:GntR family transcriptional regulator [Pullulanibacillus pueri]MBM7682987.1 DNA-binding GntR family transcriptional regulator [Pullulanibacillus pueri]GGH85946.1 GntR family transcriptional regulator [Pullulanibacillus pueri]
MKLTISHNIPYRTKQEYVYQVLRKAIMMCELHPGEKLVISEIASQLDTSAIPVREALKILHTEDLITYNAHVGAIVAPITKDSVVETFAIKEGLEGVATRIATEKITEKEIGKLQRKLANMDLILEQRDYGKWGQLNAEFHQSIVNLTLMPTLNIMHTKVLDKWDRIHRYFFSEILIDRHDESQSEHYEILEAIKDGKGEKAELLTKRHNQYALKEYMNFLNNE